MTKEEAYEIVRRVAEVFATGSCEQLPTTQEIEEAASVVASIAGASTPSIDHDRKGVPVLTKKLADYLKDLAAAAVAKECRDILIEQFPSLDDKLPGPKRKV